MKKIGPAAVVQIVIGAVVLFGLGVVTGQRQAVWRQPPALIKNATQNQPTLADFGLFWEAWNTVSQNYSRSINDQDRLYGAIAGMVAGLNDPFSSFMKPTQAREFNAEISGNFEGIGAELVEREGQLTVVAPLDGSPARLAGLLAGDVIVKIDGQPTPEPIDEAVAKIRGPKGSRVTLTVSRGGKAQDIAITRDRVEIKSVTYIKSDAIGLIRLGQFSATTTQGLDAALRQAERDGVRGLVVDVRNNPGGLLDAAVAVASRFIGPEVNAGVVVIERDKNHKDTQLTVEKDAPVTKRPVVVLVNQGSASAAEIFAGALQDAGRAKIVGETTFGKGSVQSVEPLSDGSNIKITVAEWLTPKGRTIDKHGIVPDIEAKSVDGDAAAGRDSQLERAKEALK